MDDIEALIGVTATETCCRCGGPNAIWSAASPLWNYVMRGNDINGEPRFRDLVCMTCFVTCAVEAGLPAHGWRLTLVPEPEGLTYETPSGRRWNAERFVWVDPGDTANEPATPSTDDTEALAAAILTVLPNRCCEPGLTCPYDAHDADRLAAAILASDWLAAHVGREIEAQRAETRRWREMWDKYGKNDLLARAEKGERERDEARAVIERVTALADECRMLAAQHFADGNPSRAGAHAGVAQRIDAALTPATEPTSDRPLTLDEHLAEVERRIGGTRFESLWDAQKALTILNAYREEVRRG